MQYSLVGAGSDRGILGRATHGPAPTGVNSMCSSLRPRRTHVGSYAKRRAPGGPWCSSDRRMSCIRSRMRSRLMRPSARASGRAGAGVVAAAERDVGLRVRPVDAELGRALEPPRVAVGGAVQQHHGRARGDVDAADGRGPAGEPEVGLHRALDPEHLLEEVRDAVAVGPQLVLELGVLGEVLQRGREQTRAVVSWPAANRNVAVRTTLMTSGVVPSG